MGRPVKWSRDARSILERASRSNTQTWSRHDIEQLFNVERATAQTLMKAIGDVISVAGTHFVLRASLLQFLNDVLAADSVERALQGKLATAEPKPRPKTLRVPLPDDLRQAMLADLPENVRLSSGRIEIVASSATTMVESLLTLALIMQNDLDRWRLLIEPFIPVSAGHDDELRMLLIRLRQQTPAGPPALEGFPFESFL